MNFAKQDFHVPLDKKVCSILVPNRKRTATNQRTQKRGEKMKFQKKIATEDCRKKQIKQKEKSFQYMT